MTVKEKTKDLFFYSIMFYCSCVAAVTATPLAAWVGEASGETSGEPSTETPGEPDENPRRRPRGAPGH